MDDKFNTIEKLQKEFFESDNDICQDVKYFHTKLLADPASYNGDQLPAMAIHAIGFESVEDERKLNYISTIIEITHRGGDLETVDEKVKKIMSNAIDKLRAESPRNHGNGFTDKVDDIRVDNAEIVFGSSQGTFTVIASIAVSVGIVER
jgi:hypothetical protein